MDTTTDDNHQSRDGRTTTRKMVRAELLGRHSHATRNGVDVHIWTRQDKYLARGSHNGQRFGVTLGAAQQEAEERLRHLLVEIDNGSFKRPSDARTQPLKTGVIPQLTIRQGCSEFLAEKRRLRGKKTTANYQSRLRPLIEFAEHPDNRRRWPYLEHIDRQFAIEFRAFLNQRTTTRNGHPAAEPRPLSARQIRNVLTCAGTLINWARHPQVNLLAAHVVNPFDREIVGHRQKKDPWRPIVFPVDFRIELVRQMDLWQLTHFAIPLTLPLRPEDYTGLLISEADIRNHILSFKTRLGGCDFNKGMQEFSVPFPPEIAQLLEFCAAERPEGPLFRSRAISDGRRSARLSVNSTQDLIRKFEAELSNQPLNEIQTEQDRKRLFRGLLIRCSGVSVNALSREFQRILAATGSTRTGRFYDLRGSVNTEMERSGVSHLVQRYVTGHATDDILNEYVSLDPVREMSKYFAAIRPLLDAMAEQFHQFL